MSFVKKPQMTSAEFTAAMCEAGFGVHHGRIVGVSGQCPGFATLPSFNKGAVDRNAALSKVLFVFLSVKPSSGRAAAEAGGEVLDAERRFRELSEAGYTAAKRTANGMSEVIRQFDPTVKETLFIPRLVGG
jgi:hypothetical protein